MYIMKIMSWVDCSQSPIFSWDRLDIPRLLTVTAILILKCTEGAGVGDYGPLGSFDTHARWVARNAKLSISMILRKNRRLWTVYVVRFKNIPVEPF